MKLGGGGPYNLFVPIGFLGVIGWFVGYLVNAEALSGCQDPSPTLHYGETIVVVGVAVWGVRALLADALNPPLWAQTVATAFVGTLWTVGLFVNQRELGCQYSGEVLLHYTGQILMVFGLSIEVALSGLRLWVRAHLAKEDRKKRKKK